MSKKSKITILTVTGIISLIIVAAGVYLYVSNNASPATDTDQAQTKTIDTSVLPDDAKSAVKDDLDITAEEYLKQSQIAAELDTYEQQATKDTPDDFAGVYLDQKGTPRLNVTSEKAKASAKSNAQLPKNTQVEVVERSQAALQEITKETEEWAATLPEETKQAIGGIAPNVPDNNVMIIVKQTANANITLELPDSIKNVSIVETNNETDPAFPVPIYNDKQQIIAAEHSVSLAATSTQALPTKQLSDGNMYGGDGYGVSGTMKDGTFGKGFCSLGFNGKDAQAKPIIFTAGHCATSFSEVSAQNPGVSTTLKIAAGDTVTSQGFGKFIGNKHDTPEARDVAIAQVTSLQSKFANAGVRTSSGTIKVTGTANPVLGMPLCKSGRTTGYTCGRVYLTGVSLPVGGTWSKKLFVSTACARPGDSGGAVFTGTKALGLTTGGPMLTGVDTAGCFKNDLLSVLFGRISYMTPINEALTAFPGTKLNTTATK